MERRTQKCEHLSAVSLLKIVGGIALAVVAVGVFSQLRDIRRYIKIASM